MATGSSLGDLFVNIIANNDQYDSAIDGSKKKTEKFETGLTKLSGTVKKLIGAGVLIALAKKVADVGKASINAASDAEEANAKFNTAFAGITARADETATALKEAYGLSQTESEKLLGSTGDLLKGFGATADEALDFSAEIQKLAVDLASYNNVQGGASRVSNILTKSVLGNKDGLSELGVSLLDVDIKQELVRTGQDKLTGQAGKLAKAQATYTLILQQTGDAQGDFTRTQDSYANKMKVATARTNDLQVELGRALLPAATKGVGIFSDLTGKLGEYIKGLNDVRVAEEAQKSGNATREQTLALLNKTVTRLKDEIENQKESQKLTDDRLAQAGLSVTAEEKANSLLGKSIAQKELALGGALRSIETTELEIQAINDLAAAEKEKSDLKAEQDTKDEQAASNRDRENKNLLKDINDINNASKTDIEIIDEKIAQLEEFDALDKASKEAQKLAIQNLQADKKAILDEEITLEAEKREAIKQGEVELANELSEIRLQTAADKEEKRLAEIEGNREAAQFAIDSATNIAAIISNFNTEEINGIEEAKNRQIAALDEELLGTDEYNKQKVDIEKAAANKIYEIELAQFNTKKALALSQIAIDTAIGVAKVYGQTGVFGLAAQVPVIAMGVLQAAVVASEPAPPKPAFAQGGVATAATTAIVGEAGGDVLLGMGAKGAPLIEELASRLAQKSGGGGITINLNGNGIFSKRDLDDFARKVRPSLVREDQRRGIV